MLGIVVVVRRPIAAIGSVLVVSVGAVGVSLELGWHHRGVLGHGRGRRGRRRRRRGWGVGVIPCVLLLGSDGHHEETQQEADPEMSGPGGMMARQHGGFLTMKMQWNGVLLSE